ncbi:PQQ-dependent oxidoreductase, gdhB family [Devosia sp. LC5]|uniref:PQQ-dependent sugar dehydrogenase n=1 Tax=Devosia sp. LC5 TaxID=1502724 RepID=UPI0004E3D346|nr:PQQ-dependent sugar dehydrogenase [Devosia sp. LC5]KFC66986.1 PQQ-dependent oxidoreductase, gdhB family [Devosia sp. LC5]
MFHLSPSRLPVFAGAALALSLAAPISAQTIETSAGPLTAMVIAEGLDHPWALGFLPDGRMLVTERSGQLRVVDQDGAVGAPIEGLPAVVARAEGGLLDLALAPDFAESGRIYLSFSEPGEGGQGTAVLAATLSLAGDSGALSERNVIFRMNNFTGGNLHYGSRIVIGQDGNLFVTLGERGGRDRAQDMSDLAGAVVRIAPDGSVPDDNPRPEGWAPELWSKGHRNPQGAAIRQSDGALFIVEHGASGGDEVNMPRPGANYGWPVIAYGEHYSGDPIGEGTEKEGMEQPLHYWDPSISPSGLTFYDAELIKGWQGDLITGGLSGNVMVRLDMDGDTVVGEERLFEGELGRIRDVRVGPDGAIYALTDADNGQVIRVAPEGV